MNLDRLKSIRGGHRGVITKLTKEIDTLLVREPRHIGRLQVINEQLKNKLTVLQKLDDDILTLCESDDIAREIDESETISATVIDYKCRIDACLSPPSGTALSGAPPAAVASEPAIAKTRLPRLELKRFKGDVTCWITFWDTFKAAVHENVNISKIDKFHYLNSLLDGTASRAIQSLGLTEANYDSAIALLQERFGDPQVIIKAHMDEFLKLPNCTADRPSALCNIYDRIVVHTRGLSSLGLDLRDYGSLLILIIMPKLPNEVCLRMARQHHGSVWKVTDLLEIIKVEVEARETSNLVKLSDLKPTLQHKPPVPTANSFYAGNSTPHSVYCDGDHYPSACTSVRDIKERWAILIRGGRCFNCLRPHHRAKDCDSYKKCKHCHKRHHQSICDQLPPPEPTRPPEVTKTTNNTSNVERSSGLVLLQTARAIASGKEGSSVNIRILFDTGSQRSYITEALCRRLKLKAVKKERLHLNTFGEPTFKAKTCDLVQIMLQKTRRSDCLVVEALSFPTICSSLPSAISIEQFPELCDLELADPPSDKSESIDLLVGSDYYWNIVEEDTVHTDGGSTAVKSKLGWLLSGPLTSLLLSNSTFSHLTLCQGFGELRETPINEPDSVDVALRSFWELESLGIEEVQGYDEPLPFLDKIAFVQG